MKLTVKSVTTLGNPGKKDGWVLVVADNTTGDTIRYRCPIREQPQAGSQIEVWIEREGMHQWANLMT